MREPRKQRPIVDLVHDFAKFVGALGQTWITYLAFLPSIESLASAYYNVDFPIHFSAWVKASFSAVVLLLAGFTVWREQYRAKDRLIRSISPERRLCPRYEFSGQIAPIIEYTSALKKEAKREKDWAEARITKLPKIYDGSLAFASLGIGPDRHDYERYIEKMDRYLKLLNHFEGNDRYQQRCVIEVENIGAKADEKIRITLNMKSSEATFMEWPHRLLDRPCRPQGRAMPHFDLENARSVPFREVLSSEENFVSIELRGLRPGEKARLLRFGFLVSVDSRAEFNFEIISNHLPEPQVGCFVIKRALESQT